MADYNPGVRGMKGPPNVYLRMSDGRVLVGQRADAVNRRGAVVLDEYGRFYLDPHHPLDHLFRQGGAKELTLAQIKEEGWAIRPGGYYVDGKKIEFPQLKDADPAEVAQCPYCERTGTQAAVFQHMEVIHQKQAESEGLANALARALKANEVAPAVVPAGGATNDEKKG